MFIIDRISLVISQVPGTVHFNVIKSYCFKYLFKLTVRELIPNILRFVNGLKNNLSVNTLYFEYFYRLKCIYFFFTLLYNLIYIVKIYWNSYWFNTLRYQFSGVHSKKYIDLDSCIIPRARIFQKRMRVSLRVDVWDKRHNSNKYDF